MHSREHSLEVEQELSLIDAVVGIADAVKARSHATTVRTHKLFMMMSFWEMFLCRFEVEQSQLKEVICVQVNILLAIDGSYELVRATLSEDGRITNCLPTTTTSRDSTPTALN